jgi:hypothetical protein
MSTLTLLEVETERLKDELSLYEAVVKGTLDPLDLPALARYRRGSTDPDDVKAGGLAQTWILELHR